MADDTTKLDDSTGLGALLKQQQDTTKQYLEQYKAGIEERKKVTEQEIPKLEELSQRELDIAGKPIAIPRTPHLAPIPQAPQQEFRDPINAFGNPLVIMASIGSLFTRTPAIAALNAGAAAMNAYHEGDKEKIEQTRQNFEDKMRTVLAQNEQEMQLYNAELQKTHISMSEKMTNMSAIAHAFQNREVIAAMRVGDADAGLKLIDAQMSAQTTAQQQWMHWEEFQQRQQDLQQQRAIQNTLAQEKIDEARERHQQTAATARTQYVDEAKNQIEALDANENVNRGGITITPDMWKKYKEMKTPPIGYTPAQKAMEEMRKAAAGIGAPGRHGPQQTPQMVPGQRFNIPQRVIDAQFGGQKPKQGQTFTLNGQTYVVNEDGSASSQAPNPNAVNPPPPATEATNPYAGAATM